MVSAVGISILLVRKKRLSLIGISSLSDVNEYFTIDGCMIDFCFMICSVYQDGQGQGATCTSPQR